MAKVKTIALSWIWKSNSNTCGAFTTHGTGSAVLFLPWSVFTTQRDCKPVVGRGAFTIQGFNDAIVVRRFLHGALSAVNLMILHLTDGKYCCCWSEVLSPHKESVMLLLAWSVFSRKTVINVVVGFKFYHHTADQEYCYSPDVHSPNRWSPMLSFPLGILAIQRINITVVDFRCISHTDSAVCAQGCFTKERIRNAIIAIRCLYHTEGK